MSYVRHIGGAAAAMLALESYLISTASPNALFFNDATPKIDELKDRLAELTEQAKNLQAKADAEKRPLTEDEQKAIENIFDEFEDIEADVDRRQQLSEIEAKVAAPQGRRTQPNDVANQDGEDVIPAARQRNGRTKVAAQPRNLGDAARHGFDSFGQFALAVHHASQRGAQNIDPRLIANAPSTYGTEGTGSDGGFAVPPEYRSAIMTKVMGEDSLLARTDQLTSSSNSITLPTDETTPWQTSGGILANWEGEAGQFTQSKPNLGQTTIRLNKLGALVPVTEELLEDASALASYINRKTPEKFTFKINDAIINGTGAGQPKGILAADSLVTVSKESGQAADTLNFNNIVNMWARLYGPCRSGAVWLVNQDVEPQLLSMAFPGSGTAVPVYLPPGGLSNNPYGTLMGRPVITTEACQTIGDKGDIILADLRQYMTAMKTGGIRADVSMHLFFDYDMTAFRFVMRVAGQPWWASAISPKNGSNTRGCFVTLEAR